MKYRVVLNEEEQKELQSIVRRGKHSARKIRWPAPRNLGQL